MARHLVEYEKIDHGWFWLTEPGWEETSRGEFKVAGEGEEDLGLIHGHHSGEDAPETLHRSRRRQSQMQVLSVAQKLQVNGQAGTPREEQGREHSELGGPGGENLWGRTSKREELPREKTLPLPDYPSESLSSTNLSTHRWNFTRLGRNNFCGKNNYWRTVH